MKKNEGITLIALIITIIILIILTAITINNVIGPNLIGLAGSAAGNYIDAETEEEDKISELMSKVGEVEAKLPQKLSNIVTAKNYGDYVDYPVDLDGNPSNNDWKIFYKNADGRIFIIAADYVPNTKISTAASSAGMTQAKTYNNYWKSAPTAIDTNYKTNILELFSIENKYALTNNINSYCVSKLLTTNYWNDFKDTQLAECAVGGATLEMWCASWNAYLQAHPNGSFKAITAGNTDTTGYNVSSDTSQNQIYLYMTGTTNELDSGLLTTLQSDYSLFFPHTADRDDCYGYWLASPSAYNGHRVMAVCYLGDVGYDRYSIGDGLALRPIVCLDSKVSATYNAETKTYTLSK